MPAIVKAQLVAGSPPRITLDRVSRAYTNADLAVYAANPLTAAELQQLQNINSSTISSGQWAGISALTTAEMAQLANIDANTINSADWAIVAGIAAVGGGSDISITSANDNNSHALSAWHNGHGIGSDTVAYVGFWPDVTATTRKHVFRDRIFLSAGANVTGNFTGTQGASSVAPTATEGANWLLRDADVIAVSSIGRISFLGFTRTSDQILSPAAGYGAGISIAAGVINNGNAGGTNTFAWAFYADVQHEATASGWTAAMEQALKNKSATNYTTSPYNWSSAGVYGLWQLVGGDNSYGGANANPITALIASRPGTGTTPTANAGWVLKDGTLTTSGGIATLLHMPVGYALRWDRSNDTLAARIYSNVTNTSIANQGLVFTDNGVTVQYGGVLAMQVDIVSSLVNRLHVLPSATGAPVEIYPNGSDTDISLRLQSKGAAEVVAFRTDSSTNTAPTVATLRRASTGAITAGIGAALAFEVETANDNFEIGGKISAVSTSVTGAAEAFDMLFSVMTAGGQVDRLRLTPTALLPEVDDGLIFGSATKRISDFFAASGFVFNFDNGNYTFTHAAGTMTFAGGPLTAPSFIPSSSTVPSNGMYLQAANTLGWAINSAAELALSATALYPASNDGLALGIVNTNAFSDVALASGAVIDFDNSDVKITHAANTLTFEGASTGYTFLNGVVRAGAVQFRSGYLTAIPAGGSNSFGFTATSTSNFGVFFGSGAPSLSAAQGSLYLRSDGSATNNRAYINTDGGTTWTPLTTAA